MKQKDLSKEKDEITVSRDSLSRGISSDASEELVKALSDIDINKNEIVDLKQ